MHRVPDNLQFFYHALPDVVCPERILNGAHDY